MKLSEGVTTVLTPAKEMLWKGGFSCDVLLQTDRGDVVGVQCTLDTRGLRGQPAADERAAAAKAVIQALCDEHGLQICMLASGHTFDYMTRTPEA